MCVQYLQDAFLSLVFVYSISICLGLRGAQPNQYFMESKGKDNNYLPLRIASPCWRDEPQSFWKTNINIREYESEALMWMREH